MSCFFSSAEEPIENPPTDQQVNLPENRQVNLSLDQPEANDQDAEGDQVPERLIFSPPLIRNLPGPSQVVTHPGTSGIDSHGHRQRRRGVSGPPTGTNHYPANAQCCVLRTRKLVQILFWAAFNLFCSFLMFFSDFSSEIKKTCLEKTVVYVTL